MKIQNGRNGDLRKGSFSVTGIGVNIVLASSGDIQERNEMTGMERAGR